MIKHVRSGLRTSLSIAYTHGLCVVFDCTIAPTVYVRFKKLYEVEETMPLAMHYLNVFITAQYVYCSKLKGWLVPQRFIGT
jgi:hypothetical protein